MVTLLHFLDADPRDCWDSGFAAIGSAGRSPSAAFVPTKHGSNTYTDELF